MKFYAFSVGINEEWDEETDELHVVGTVLLGNQAVFAKQYQRYEANEDSVLAEFAGLLGDAIEALLDAESE